MSRFFFRWDLYGLMDECQPYYAGVRLKQHLTLWCCHVLTCRATFPPPWPPFSPRVSAGRQYPQIILPASQKPVSSGSGSVSTASVSQSSGTGTSPPAPPPPPPPPPDPRVAKLEDMKGTVPWVGDSGGWLSLWMANVFFSLNEQT